MKHIFISSLLAFGALTGCATVSMVPGSVVVESAVLAEQSRLRDVSNAYIETAEAEHWIRPSRDLWSFAKMLANGDTSEINPVTYTDFIEQNYTDAGVAMQRIGADIGAAETGLVEIINLANELLLTPAKEVSLRTDTYSFESVLVTAQKARRNFAEAAYVTARSYEVDEQAVSVELAALDAAIAEAQITADSLAAHGVTDGNAETGV